MQQVPEARSKITKKLLYQVIQAVLDRDSMKKMGSTARNIRLTTEARTFLIKAGLLDINEHSYTVRLES